MLVFMASYHCESIWVKEWIASRNRVFTVIPVAFDQNGPFTDLSHVCERSSHSYQILSLTGDGRGQVREMDDRDFLSSFHGSSNRGKCPGGLMRW
jgi:hypothetical protein